jgi:hypothetical protein
MLGKLLRAALLLAALPTGFALAHSPATLPVYIEDAHNGSYYWMIQHLSLQHDFQLVLIDAHSDASAILGSDAIRRRVMESAGSGQLESLARQWRKKGSIQCYNWIEPLLPHPITKVWWIPAESLSNSEVAHRQQEVRDEIDANQEAEPREDGEFANRYEIAGLDRFPWNKLDGPVVVTVDLDYFAGISSADEIRQKLDRILDSVLQIPDLQALTFSISRPYLASQQQADQLLIEALRYTTHIVNADIHYEPFESTGPDWSEKAKQLYRQRLPVPRYNVEDAPPRLRTLILQNASRIRMSYDSPRWEALLRMWRRDESVPRVTLSVDHHPTKAGAEFTLAAEQRFQLKVGTRKLLPGAQIRWKVLSPEHSAYNLTGENKEFAIGAPRYIVDRDLPVDSADDHAVLTDEQLMPFFDKKTALGTLRVFCEITDGTNTYISNVVTISRFRGNGYLGKLTEIFNLPYVLGSALLNVDGQTSADARQGADCSHFIIYGRRREGANIPYVNPKDLLPYLELIDEFQGFKDGVAYGRHGPIQVTPALLKRGLLLHFGNHMAAVYGPSGQDDVLTGDTLVVHQLEGPPEITTFAVMAAKYYRIRVMTFR